MCCPDITLIESNLVSQKQNPVSGDEHQIYAVFASHLERNVLLGYCYAQFLSDIEAYYEDRKAYGIAVEQVNPIQIPHGYATRKAALVAERDELNRKLKDLDREIANCK